MAKVKITKSEVPILKEEVSVDVEVMEQLKSVQEAYQKKFKDRIEASQQEALEKYTARIESLKKAKSEMVKEYNAEIKGYQSLVNELKKPAEKK